MGEGGREGGEVNRKWQFWSACDLTSDLTRGELGIVNFKYRLTNLHIPALFSSLSFTLIKIIYKLQMDGLGQRDDSWWCGVVSE